MGKMVRLGGLALIGVFLVLGSRAARANYVLSVEEAGTGLTSADRRPGQSIDLDISLASNAAAGVDVIDGFLFNLGFSEPGLLLNSYSFDDGGVFVAGSAANDFTNPKLGTIPAGGFELTGGVRFQAAQESFGVNFGDGRLVSLQLTVPDTFPLGPVLIEAEPDQFTNPDTFDLVPTTSGGAFTLNVTPEPATLMLLGIGGGAILLRRRRTS